MGHQMTTLHDRLRALRYAVKCYSVTAFQYRGSGGNQHCVVVLPALAESFLRGALNNIQQLSVLYGETIFVVLCKVESNSASAYFFHNGYAVQRCGSGSLAAAKILYQEYSAQNGVNTKPIELQTCTQRLTLYRHSDHQYSYLSPVLPAQIASSQVTRLLSFLLGVSCREVVGNAFNVGGRGDYYLLALKDAATLKALQPKFRLIAQYTQRAVIVTAPLKNTGKRTLTASTFDYGLRYFAPQYGNQEDAATGSAHAQVAAYWQRYYRTHCVRGLQLSSEGGQFTVCRHKQWQRVKGEVRVLDC